MGMMAELTSGLYEGKYSYSCCSDKVFFVNFLKRDTPIPDEFYCNRIGKAFEEFSF